MDDARLYDTLLAQRALWSTLAFLLVGKHGLTVELRLGAHGRGLPAFSELRLYGTPTAAVSADLKQLEAVLPSDFRWAAAPDDTEFERRPVRIARVVRRLEYMDLPSTPAFALSDGDMSGHPTRPSGSAEAHLHPVSLDVTVPRELPRLETTTAELHLRRFCLPIPSPIREEKPRPKAIFEAIQRSGRALVSICLHPISDAERTRAQVMTVNWQRCLVPYMAEIANSTLSDLASLQSAYSRFSLPGAYLFNISVRVASDTTESAMNVANLVAEAAGGSRGFRVVPPTRDADMQALVQPDLDIPSSSWSSARLGNVRQSLRAELSKLNIEEVDEDEIIDFLLRMPHVYSLDESRELLALPMAHEEGLPGMETHIVPPFTLPSLPFQPVLTAENETAAPPRGLVRVGMVQKPGISLSSSNGHRYANYYWHTVDPVDLTKHALIVGSTGSGKTMTTSFLLRELDRLNVPIMIIEPVKTEYLGKLQGVVAGLKRFRLEGSKQGSGPGAGYLAFDPMRVPKGITVARHCSYLKSCFEAAFPLTDILALLLENGIRRYYEAPTNEGGCGLQKFTRGDPRLGRIQDGKVFPSFRTFCDFFADTYLAQELAGVSDSKGSGDVRMLIEAFRRRFRLLQDGLVGECFKVADLYYIRNGGRPAFYDPFEPLLKRNVIIELDGIPDADQKALVMAFLLTKIFEHRQAEDFEARSGGAAVPSGLRHFLVVEEAHRLLATGASAIRGSDTVGDTAKAKAVQLFVDMLAEIRAFGQGLAIVEQIPTKIVPEAVKNTNLKIMLRLTALDDREYLGEAMNFTEEQKRFVTNLKVERGRQINFVVFEEGVEQPLLLSLPLPEAGDEPYNEFFSKRGGSP